MFKKILLIALVAALSLAALPTNAYAVGLNEGTNPPERPELTEERLETIWQKELAAYERLGRAEKITERIQTLIEKANERGLDTAAVQAALDAFNAAAKDAHPLYESMKGIINSHQGFDADGKVTDMDKAKETVKKMGASLREIREITGESGKALREAIKAFREANPRPERSDGEKPDFAPSH